MKTLGPIKDPGSAGSLTIRRAGPEDAGALAALAALDSSHVPAGTVLLAEVGGEPWAAISVDDLHVVADPFRPTGELVWLLVERARQLGRRPRPPRRRGSRRLRAHRPALG